jgi:hypothetical protein
MLWYLDHHGRPLERGVSQGKVGEIQVEYVEEDIEQDEDRGPNVDRPPEKRRRVRSKIMKHQSA